MTRFSRREALGLGALAGLASLACQPAGAPEPAVTAAVMVPQPRIEPWRHGVVQVPFNAVFQRRAGDLGFWLERGISTEFVVQNSDSLIVRALVAGELDTAEIAPQGVLAAIEDGAPLKLLGSFTPRLPGALMARPPIADLQGLAGQTVAITSRGSQAETILRALLAERAPGVFERVILAPTPNQQGMGQALIAGQANAAASINPEYVGEVEAAGGGVIARYATELPAYLRMAIVTTNEAIARRGEVLQRWFTGNALGIRAFLEIARGRCATWWSRRCSARTWLEACTTSTCGTSCCHQLGGSRNRRWRRASVSTCSRAGRRQSCRRPWCWTTASHGRLSWK